MAIAQSRCACACVLLWADGTISHSLSHALRLGTDTATELHAQSTIRLPVQQLPWCYFSQLGSRRNSDCHRSFFALLLCVIVVFHLPPLLFPLVEPHISTSLLHQLELSFIWQTYFFFLSIHHPLHHVSSLFCLHGPNFSSPLFSSIVLIRPFISCPGLLTSTLAISD